MGNRPKVYGAATSIHQHADADGNAAKGANRLDNFLYRAAGGHDIFYDEDAFLWRQSESPTKGHAAVFPLGEDRPRTQGFTHFVG